MLNPTFPKSAQAAILKPYVAPLNIATATLSGNQDFDTGGVERRTSSVFGDEIWMKLEHAGFSPARLREADVLEVCAGTGFLTYHLLQRCLLKRLTVNDISSTELSLAQAFIEHSFPDVNVDWALGDMCTHNFGRQFDLIIGNSFIHHFHDVPKLMARFAEMLKPGGVFISLHEPTPMSTVVESGKALLWPVAVLAPRIINDIARARYKGQPSTTDLWMFEAKKIKRVALEAGFVNAKTIPWGLVRAIVVNRRGLHLSEKKPNLSIGELNSFQNAIKADAMLNRVLPQRCFGSICLVCSR